jgi:DinB family protein
MSSPYAQHVGDRDPVEVLRSSLDGYQEVVDRLTAEMWQRPWAPSKWTAEQIMVHVAQWEMILGIRLRCGVAAPNYLIQPIDQDEIMRRESAAVDGSTAYAAFDGSRRMNLAFAESLSAADRQHRLRHPEQGEIDVEYLLVTMAGHAEHHLKQLRIVLDS